MHTFSLVDDSGWSSPQIHPSIQTSSYLSLLPSLETGGRFVLQATLVATLQYHMPGLLSSIRSSMIVIKSLLRLGSTTLSIITIPAGKTYPPISNSAGETKAAALAKPHVQTVTGMLLHVYVSVADPGRDVLASEDLPLPFQSLNYSNVAGQ